MRESKLKHILTEGIRDGLLAFVIAYGLSFVTSLIINFALLEKINTVLHGALSGKLAIGFNSVLRISSVILNISVFNSVGEVQFGMIIFAIIPFVAFYLADKVDNKKDGVNTSNIEIYLISSMVFSLLLSLLSLSTKGKILDFQINFFSIRNFFVTIFIVFLIQAIIGTNYNINKFAGIRATRIMFRIVIGVSIILGLVGLVMVLSSKISSILGIILITIVLLPNIAMYSMFLLMGINLHISEPLLKLVDFANENAALGFGGLPIWLKMAALTVFFVITIFSTMYINKEKYFVGLIAMAVSFSLFSTLVAFCTRINLGIVKNLLEVELYINGLIAFIVPFTIIITVGCITFLIKKVVSIVME